MRGKALNIFIVLIVLSIIGININRAKAADYPVDEEDAILEYNILDEENRTVEVSNNNNNNNIKNVTIPKTIELNNKEYTVIKIGEDGFRISSLEKLTMPDSVISIGQNAFSGCRNLTSIVIPDSVTSIGRGAFSDSGLTNLIIPNGVTSIEDYAFSKCSSLREVTMPDSITSIGVRAFENCYSLTEVTIPEGVRTIKEMAFCECYNLKSIKIPKSIEKIEHEAIARCSSDLVIYVYEDSYGYNYAKENNMKFEIIKENQDVPETPNNPNEPENPGGNTEVPPSTGNQTGQVVSKPFHFVDVKQSNWYYNSVKFVYDKDIILGTTATTFKPNNNLTRGMLVTILWRMEGSPVNSSGKEFPDVKQSEYYYTAVKWAASNRIVNGHDDGKFKPNSYITREQLAVMLYNYAKYKGKTGAVPTNISRFADYKKVSSYATESVKWAITNKIISGKENGSKIAPQGNATRAETAAMIQNYLTYVK